MQSVEPRQAVRLALMLPRTSTFLLSDFRGVVVWLECLFTSLFSASDGRYKCKEKNQLGLFNEVESEPAIFLRVNKVCLLFPPSCVQ